MASGSTLTWRVAPGIAPGWLLPALVGLFFLSGMSGLIYQVLWLRLLALVFGVTVWAASTVLASFMAGLALGSLAAGRLVDRARQPLLWYGLAEVLVGLSALSTPALLDLVEQAYVGLAPSLPQSLGPLTAVRFVFSFAVLLVPTTLMGATLPIVIRSSLLRAHGLGQRASLLYASNTAGAALGALLAGFVLIGGVGIGASFRLAAALNILVGVAAAAATLALARARAAVGSPVAATIAATVAPASTDRGLSESARRLVLLVFAVSGFATLALEVIWFRVLVLYVDVTTYAFTIMLVTVLCGIAVGSFLVAPLMRRRLDWLAILAGLELALAVTAVLSLAALAESPGLLASARALLGGRLPFLPEPLSLAPVASFAALFPATLAMGVAFPIGLRLWVGEGGEAAARSGARVGLFYSLNVCGSILGSIVAGFVLLPSLGSQVSLVAVAALPLLSGLLLLGAVAGRSRMLAVGSAGLGLFIAAAATMPEPFSQAVALRYPGERLLWHEEGVQTTVTVHERPNGARALYFDGRYQASDDQFQLRIHRLVGHLPMVLHPDPREALVVGLGGGVTTDAMRRYDASVDVVELSGSVVRAAEWFSHVNHDALRQPNVRLRVDDGRNYLLLTSRRYHVITSDLIGPTQAGAGHLYSVEYFRQARQALTDDGLMLHWLVLLPETQHKLIVRSFLAAFPESTLWFDGTFLVGSRQPLRLAPAAFERKLRLPAVQEGLASVGLDRFEALLAQYQAGPAELHAYAGPGPLLTDDRPMVEYFLSLPADEPQANLSNVRGDVGRLLGP